MNANATRRLARDLHDAGAPEPRVTPWGLEYPAGVVATASPPSDLSRVWSTKEVLAVSATVKAALARSAIPSSFEGLVLPLPDLSMRAGTHQSGVVRCDDAGAPSTADPSDDPTAGYGLGAFLLCWARDRPHARWVAGPIAGDPPARALGCPVQTAGDQPTVVVCAGAQDYPPPLIVDALAAGIPVAGVRTPGLAEVVGDAGLLVDRAGGIETLAEALATLLGDRELAAFVGASGPARVAQLAPARGLQRLAARLRSG